MLIESVLWAVLCIVATSRYGFGDGMRISLALGFSYLLIRLAYERMGKAVMLGRLALLAVGTMLVIATMSYLSIWIVGDYSFDFPNLRADDRAYFRYALYLYDERVPQGHVAFPGLSTMVMCLWKVLGVHVIWGIALNMFFTLMSVVVIGQTCRRLLAGRVDMRPEVISGVGMMCCLGLAFFLSQGVRFQKEALVYLSISLVGFVLAGVGKVSGKRALTREVMLFAVACLVLGFGRTTYLYYVAVGVLLVCGGRPREHWRFALLLLVVMAVAFYIGNSVSYYSLERHASIINGKERMQLAFSMNGPQQPYHDLIGQYYMYPVAQRIALLPLCAGVQFIIPFPWIYVGTISFVDLFPRLAWGWYAIGGVTLFYYIFVSWHKADSLGMWAWWPAICFLITAYLVAGSVSRYVLPFQPLFIPIAIYVACLIKKGMYRRTFYAWATLFLIVLTTTLVTCYHIQGYYIEAFETANQITK